MRGRKTSPQNPCGPSTKPEPYANPLPATERTLWRALRDRRLGALKFRRQAPLRPYVVDFLCLRHRLIIEADGPFHDAEADAKRDAWLLAQGYRVLRFTNQEVNNLDQVLGRILETMEAPPVFPGRDE